MLALSNIGSENLHVENSSTWIALFRNMIMAAGMVELGVGEALASLSFEARAPASLGFEARAPAFASVCAPPAPPHKLRMPNHLSSRAADESVKVHRTRDKGAGGCGDGSGAMGRAIICFGNSIPR